MVKYTVDLDKLNKHIGRICLCLRPCMETNKKENVCPCKDFLDKGECRCRLFELVEE